MNMRRIDKSFENQRRNEMRRDKQHQRYSQQKIGSLIKYRAYLRIISFSVSPPQNDLRSQAKPESNHIKCHEIDSGNGRSSQFDFTDTPHKGGIGHADELLHYETDKNRIGNEPNLFIAEFYRIISHTLSNKPRRLLKDRYTIFLQTCESTVLSKIRKPSLFTGGPILRRPC